MSADPTIHVTDSLSGAAPGLDELRAHLIGLAGGPARRIVAITGAPASGKSTLAENLCDDLNRRLPGCAAVLPMDGYHLDNAILDESGWRDRKGAPQTFDTEGLAQDLGRVRADRGPVLVPVFDRRLDLSRNAARRIAGETRVILVEGNYLLLDQAPWSALAPLFDLTIFLSVPETLLEERLVQRWLDHGHTPEHARARALSNDIPNARLVVRQSRLADVTVNGG